MTAGLLRSLHVPGTPLVLPNAWDAGTARLVAEAGFPVVATSSAAVAESGYGLPAAEFAARLSETGAMGCNLEDTDHRDGGLTPVARQAEYLAAVRAAAPDLVINARVDMFLGAEDQRAVLDEGAERARTYLAAGADCVYPILVRSPELLRSFVDAVGAPVNATLLPGTTVAEVAAAGAARISLGAGLWRFTQAALRERLAGLR